MNSFYSRLGVKVIKDFSTSPNFEVACKRFHYESGKSEAFQKEKKGLQCYLTVPRRVRFIYDNRIDLNEDKMCSKNLMGFHHHMVGSHTNI